jgi:restriction endonuclease Mrr
MTQLNIDGRLVLRAGRRPQLKRYLADTVEDEPQSFEEESNSSVAAIVRGFSRALALALARAPGALADMEWRDLERVLAEACEGLGFRTTLTRPAKDGGFDLEVEADGTRYLIEVKHWSAPALVGAEVVSQFAEVVVSKAAAKGLLLSSSGFRPAVLAQRIEIVPSPVALGDGRKIVGLCQRYARRSGFEWWPETNLAEILFEETL